MKRATTRGRKEITDLVVLQTVQVQAPVLPAVTGPAGDPPHVHPLAAAEASESGIVWRQREDGLWHAKGVGGTYYAITKPSGIEAVWIGTDGNQIDLGRYETLSAAFQACRRFLPEKAAAEVVPVLHESESEAAEGATSTHMADGIAWADYGRDPERQKRLVEWGNKVGKVDSPQRVYEIVEPYMSSQKQEVFLVLPLDIHGKPTLGVCKVAQGQRARVAVSPADIMQKVLQSGASSFVVIHNHPSGKATPSEADKRLTQAIKQAAALYKPDVVFDDHVLVGLGEYYSFEHEGLKRVGQ